jgi:hypothetical protein
MLQEFMRGNTTGREAVLDLGLGEYLGGLQYDALGTIGG